MNDSSFVANQQGFNLAFSIICFHSYRLVKKIFVLYIYDIPRGINNFYVSKCRVERQKTGKIKKMIC